MPQIVQAVVRPLGCLPELNGKTLLLKTEHRETNLELSWKPLLANEHLWSREGLCRQRNNNGLLRCGPCVLVTFYITERQLNGEVAVGPMVSEGSFIMERKPQHGNSAHGHVSLW